MSWRAQVQFALLALQALARPGAATWSAEGFLGLFAEVRFGSLEEATAVSVSRVLVEDRPVLPLPYVLGLQATALRGWFPDARRRRALRLLWRRAGLIEAWRAAEGELVLRFDPEAARGPAC